MFAFLQQAGSQVPGSLQIIQSVLVGLQSLFIIAGIIAAYYRFVKEKPHTFRLQPSVSGTVEAQGATLYLVAKVIAHNTGQVDIPLDLESTGLRIETRRARDDEWRLFGTQDVFLGNSPVRPGEEIEDQVWVEIPYDMRIGVRLELTVVGREDENYPVWTTAHIVTLLAEEGATPSENR